MSNIIFLGAPGSGKGTQCGILSDYGFYVITAGQIMRDIIADKSNELGAQIKAIIDKGDLVDDKMVFSIVKTAITDDKKTGYIFDGYPRTVEQAKLLDDFCAKQNMRIDFVFMLKLDVEIVIKRLLSRVECTNCKYVYSREHDSCETYVDGLCAKCGCKEYKVRADDNIDAIQKRIEHYQRQVDPILEYYKKNLIILDANMKIEEIAEQIKKYINI